MTIPRHSLLSPIFLFLTIFLLSGCTVSTEFVLDDLREDPSVGSFIEGVPFYAQDEYMCGPASLASVMAYHGFGNPDMEEIAGEVYAAKLKGTLPMDMLIYAKEKGFEATYYKGSLADLKEKVSRKIPLILFLDLGFEPYFIGHYMVVTGYNDRAKAVLAHSGLDKNGVYTYERLMQAWSKTGFSTLLVSPKISPGRMR